MKTIFEIYESKYFTPQTRVGIMTLNYIPTSGLPFAFNPTNKFYLTNFLEVITDKTEKNGEYFVNGSVIYMDKSQNNQTIELFIEKNNDKADTLLYLRGVRNHTKEEIVTKIYLIGEVEAETKSTIVPITNLDFISINGMYYETEKVTYNQDGSIKINVINGVSLDSFRDGKVFGLF